jgi:hypothetical protein
MFCPRCGTNQSEELKFCKSCGANMYAVRQVVDARETSEQFDWNRTWVTEMFLSTAERRRRNELIERERGITPEVKRVHEIKAGVITSSAGIGVMILLYVLMQGIVLGGNVSHEAAAILVRLWVAGVIPVLVGMALIINGLVVSKRLVELAKRSSETEPNSLKADQNLRSLGPADSNDFIPANYSVTEETTQHLKSSARKE